MALSAAASVLSVMPECATTSAAKEPACRTASSATSLRAEIVVIGGRLGGCAASLAALLGKPEKEATAEQFPDSVGIGYYRIDLHPSSGGDNYIDVASMPFQIPLGVLIPQRVENLLPSCKNLGTTHITNGCYRLHPAEWNIGGSAGTLSAFCPERGARPSQVRANKTGLAEFHARLTAQGVPVEWPEDVRVEFDM